MRLAKAEAIYRPNLLINGDFQVWPRGESFTIQPSQTNKTAAMWQLQNQRDTAAQIFHQTTDEGKGTGFGFPGLSSMRIYQWLPIEVMKPYEGKKMTRIWSVNKQVSKEEFTLDLTENINGDYWRAFYYLSSSNDVLNFAGLYEGSVDTHFIEDEAIVQMRSSKYVRTYTGSIGIGSCTLASRIMVALPIDMYELPTITPTSISANVAGTTVSTSDLTLAGSSTKDIVYLVCNFTGNPFTAGQSGTVTVQSGRIILSCEP